MGRLCERPGCSEPASVAYGMRAEDLVFWLDLAIHDDVPSSGVLCQRHADSMVVPRHWTLDDLRDPVPRLFRPPSALPAPAPVPRRRSQPADDVSEQLLLVDDVVCGSTRRCGPSRCAGVARCSRFPWTPTFDEQDDLDGLLSATLAAAGSRVSWRRPSRVLLTIMA